MKYISITDLPQNLRDSIASQILLYSVNLIAIGECESDSGQIGSGTLVVYNNEHYILTAGHVLNHPKYKGSLAIGIGWVDRFRHDPYKFKIEKGVLKETIICDNSSMQQTKPDLGIIHLPNDRVGSLKAYCVFRKLNDHLEKSLEIVNDINSTDELWAFSGIANEDTTVEENFNNDTTLCLKNTVWFGANVKYELINDFDYYNMSVDQEGRTDLPGTFEGISGGGLWHIKIEERQDKSLNHLAPEFCGVAFYQIGTKGDIRWIRFHGPKSVCNMLHKI